MPVHCHLGEYTTRSWRGKSVILLAHEGDGLCTKFLQHYSPHAKDYGEIHGEYQTTANALLFSLCFDKTPERLWRQRSNSVNANWPALAVTRKIMTNYGIVHRNVAVSWMSPNEESCSGFLLSLYYLSHSITNRCNQIPYVTKVPGYISLVIMKLIIGTGC